MATSSLLKPVTVSNPLDRAIRVRCALSVLDERIEALRDIVGSRDEIVNATDEVTEEVKQCFDRLRREINTLFTFA